MNFELLAEERVAIESAGIAAAQWSWQAHAAYQRRGIVKPEDLTGRRSAFLIRHAMDLQGVELQEALDDPKKARGGARSLPCATREIDRAGLRAAPVDISVLPAFSAALTLRFQLLTPLLTRDDDPFYLFDNPVRKDHVYGVPFLAAASVKGLAADAFQRGFPHRLPWKELGKKSDDQSRTLRYRQDNQIAKRLFGIASDDPQELASEAGRLHFSPVWFSHVQYLVMNPSRTDKDGKPDGSGIGTQPIQFEAVAPVTEKGKPVQAEIGFFYFNPAGARDSDETTARTDIACFLGALAAWWPALGLGAKRLAGYGAIAPLSAICRATGYADMPQPIEFSGVDSWRRLAGRIAKGRA
ncbi:MAG: RAMP superfamily CRISPR-associated protein [Accumulibacter sp.]|uniref:RAMP superfamily CRISPR-associated protein n=1 Tax=Accumulibacter sp. TaxID=2053492 RepID=UPI0033162875